jgi:C-terminal processing protease CtpA/Prc
MSGKTENPVRRRGRASTLVLAIILWSTMFGAFQSAFPQGFANFSQGDGRAVLKVIRKDIEKKYYDSTFRGIDLEAHFEKAKHKIDSASSTGQVIGIIAQALLDFGDTHTFFYPPRRTARVEYGWQMQMIGDTCHVVAVQPGSDAEAKGLKVGDKVHLVSEWQPTRENLGIIEYAYYTLRPQPGMRLVVQGPDRRGRQLDVMARVTQGRRVHDLTQGEDYWWLTRDDESEARLYRHRYHEMDDDLLIWQMPVWDMSAREVRNTMNRARRFKALILDLRGNGGGLVSMLEELTGYFYDRDIEIADLEGRKKMKPLLAKTQGKRVFTGRLVVLVDSRSGSASELFARLVQLEGRGIVIGDRTAGGVMQSRVYRHQVGVNRVAPYAVSITDADMIMSDGKSLEHVGVRPDELFLPTMEDLASGRDPVLARAALHTGIELGPEEAGTLFPIEWRD